MRPRQALDTTRTFVNDLAALAEGLLSQLPEELRAIGHRPPDTLFAKVVGHLARACMSNEEIVALIDVKGPAPKGSSRHDYWMGRVERALHEPKKRKGHQ
jgi:hypothetical protein